MKEGNIVVRRDDAVKAEVAWPVAVKAKPGGVTIVWIQTNPNVLKRMEEPGRTEPWQRIGDDELLKSLRRRAGRRD